MERAGRDRIVSPEAVRIREQRKKLAFSAVPVPDPVQPALPNARISRFAGDQVTQNVTFRPPEKGDVVVEDLEDICGEFIFWDYAPPCHVACVLRLNFRQ